MIVEYVAEKKDSIWFYKDSQRVPFSTWPCWLFCKETNELEFLYFLSPFLPLRHCTSAYFAKTSFGSNMAVPLTGRVEKALVKFNQRRGPSVFTVCSIERESMSVWRHHFLFFLSPQKSFCFECQSLFLTINMHDCWCVILCLFGDFLVLTHRTKSQDWESHCSRHCDIQDLRVSKRRIFFCFLQHSWEMITA